MKHVRNPYTFLYLSSQITDLTKTLPPRLYVSTEEFSAVFVHTVCRLDSS